MIFIVVTDIRQSPWLHNNYHISTQSNSISSAKLWCRPSIINYSGSHETCTRLCLGYIIVPRGFMFTYTFKGWFIGTGTTVRLWKSHIATLIFIYTGTLIYIHRYYTVSHQMRCVPLLQHQSVLPQRAGVPHRQSVSGPDMLCYYKLY